MPPPDTPVLIIVDDDAAVLGSLRFLLEAEGFEVHAFSNGAELLALEQLPRSDCLVTNQQMPGMSGLDLFKRLRARRVMLPTILITGYLDSALCEHAAAAGITMMLEKPVLDDTLLDGIRGFCRPP